MGLILALITVVQVPPSELREFGVTVRDVFLSLVKHMCAATRSKEGTIIVETVE